ncbi:hypothetical protein MSAN_00660400 [Mycena sanguinolenta]|uniref:Uncharacterized protein n=1 Tax=Mycena sanguinolenta TaxID=230812 RepID=A0A8H6Z4N9_9AGAR|nr:hypothetical protein MSAN_00660400 [Mycena sanguinolenta]
MLSSVACRALAIAFIGLTLTNSVQGSNHPISNDIVCPANSHVSFVHNSYTYNAPLHNFTDITGSFFNISWYGGTVVSSTTGTDNVPGATRSGPFAGGIYNETLTAIEKRPDALLFSYHGKGFTFTPGPSYPALRWDGYTETMRFESICGGKATYIDVLTYTCSNNQRLTYTAWSILHTSSFDGLAQSFGATILAGDCPQEAHCDKN